MDKNVPSIPAFFKGRSLFITGGTGFMGKVLIEKLLRSCPGIKCIYILIRSKKGKSAEQRLKDITDLPLFDLLKEQQPKAIEKIKPIVGNVTELGLGLSPEDRDILTRTVSIVYHAAASVRFDDSLRDAVIMNTRGTREVVQLAQQMSHLVAFVHISTTYCHTDKKVIGEQIYPPHADWKKTIQMAEEMDSHVLDILTPKFMDPLPNTYTFTKSLAEHVINDMCSGNIPALIFRPSIVISTWKEPVPGWIDNFNGPVALLVASGKGITRSVYTNPDIIADYVPVDLVIKAIIVGTWKKGITEDLVEKYEVSVYNCSNNNIECITMGELVHMGKHLCWEIPMNSILWYPDGNVTNCWYYHFYKMIFYHLLPAIIIDGILKLIGKKPLLFKIHRKIYIANMALGYFITNQWKFINDKTVKLEDSLLPRDRDSFSYDREHADIYEYFKNAMLGGRQYLLKEDNKDLPQAIQNSRRMWLLAQIFNFLWYVFFLWLIFIKIDILGWTYKKYLNVHDYLINEDF